MGVSVSRNRMRRVWVRRLLIWMLWERVSVQGLNRSVVAVVGFAGYRLVSGNRTLHVEECRRLCWVHLQR